MDSFCIFAKYCLPIMCDWRKGWYKKHNCSIPVRTATSIQKKRANIITLEWAHYAQTSTYVVMGCSRPGQEYGGVCAFFFTQLVSADSPIEEVVLSNSYKPIKL